MSDERKACPVCDKPMATPEDWANDHGDCDGCSWCGQYCWQGPEHCVLERHDWRGEALSLRARVAELEAAISKHHSDIWGDGPIEHEADVELYSVLCGRRSKI